MMPRVQVANKLHEGRARASHSHSLHASLQTVDKPHCNGRGFAHARPTMSPSIFGEEEAISNLLA